MAQEEKAANLWTYSDAGREARARGDWAATRDNYLEARRVAPQHPSVHIRLAEAAAHLGDWDATVEHLRRAALLGGTTPLVDDPLLASLADRPDFAEVAARLRANGAPHAPAEMLVTFDDRQLFPEGIARDDRTGDLFVGSSHRHKLLRVTADGEVHTFGDPDRDTLGAILGVWVDSPRRELWAVSGVLQGEQGVNELVRLHVESGRLLGRYPVPDDGQGYMLNDVVVTPDGTAWVTESLRGGLWRVRPGGDALELFRAYPHFGFANGIAASGDGATLYVGHAEGLTAIDPATGEAAPVVPAGDFSLVAADGLTWADGALVLVQNQPVLNNRVARVTLDAGGRRALALEVLPSGLPEGLVPFTSAYGDGAVYVVASPAFDLLGSDAEIRAPAVVRIRL